MKESRMCQTCQRATNNLVNATCGHKICFNCVKVNRNTHKCANCLPLSRMRTPPKRHEHSPKQKSTKIKETESKYEYSPIGLELSQPCQHKASTYEEADTSSHHLSLLPCKQHQQPLSLYSKSTKELLCSVCLCDRSKNGNDIMPVRLAEEYLRKENKNNKEESKNVLASLNNANQIIHKNIDVFRTSMERGKEEMQRHFKALYSMIETFQMQIKEEFQTYMENKLSEAAEVQADLEYLIQTLREFRESSREGTDFQEQMYLFSSYKVMSQTIRSLSLDYLPYNRQVKLVKADITALTHLLPHSVQLKMQLPLKFGDRQKSKSKGRERGNKSAGKARREEFDSKRQSFTGSYGRQNRDRSNKKHQMSLCNNNYGIELCEQERNLYKQLLKTRFKL